mmetsp:Transcript_25529/g.61385  ORF Transcript_25529/g.61385 Transcript_25529/m.61385 type:complete len:330 (+) Transcript_25529:146-1135(+)
MQQKNITMSQSERADAADKHSAEPVIAATTSATIAVSTTDNENDNDNASVGSANSSKSEERRRRRESWRREHQNQLKADGTFPRRNSGVDEGDRKAVSARVVQHMGTKSTAKPHTLPPTVRDDVRVRSNLLRTLGIQKDGNKMVARSPMMGKGKGMQRHRRIQSAGGEALLPGGDPVGNTATIRSLLSNVRLKEELKYDSDEDAGPPPNSYSRFFGVRQPSAVDKPPKNMTNIPRRPRLIISDNVEVVPIPMRSEYSNRIKERMYSGRVELSENAQRNVVEFEAEGWDATTVLDDENQFYKCPLTGELIHPVHLAYFNKGGGEMNDDER